MVRGWRGIRGRRLSAHLVFNADLFVRYMNMWFSDCMMMKANIPVKVDINYF
jgi:hypothetical protein